MVFHSPGLQPQGARDPIAWICPDSLYDQWRFLRQGGVAKLTSDLKYYGLTNFHGSLALMGTRLLLPIGPSSRQISYADFRPEIPLTQAIPFRNHPRPARRPTDEQFLKDGAPIVAKPQPQPHWHHHSGDRVRWWSGAHGCVSHPHMSRHRNPSASAAHPPGLYLWVPIFQIQFTPRAPKIFQRIALAAPRRPAMPSGPPTGQPEYTPYVQGHAPDKMARSNCPYVRWHARRWSHQAHSQILALWY